MKTTIEASGYVIEISEQENGVVVSATKDGEMVEEFTLDLESVELETGEVESTEEFTEDDFEGEDEDFEGDHILTDKEMLHIPISVKRLYQVIEKENYISSDNTVRDKTNQVMGESKAAMVSDLEVIAGVMNGHEDILKEMFTVRADYTVSKDEFYNEIIEKGEVEDLPESINDIDNKQSIKVLFWHYYGMWLETNMLYDIEE